MKHKPDFMIKMIFCFTIEDRFYQQQRKKGPQVPEVVIVFRLKKKIYWCWNKIRLQYNNYDIKVAPKTDFTQMF